MLHQFTFSLFSRCMQQDQDIPTFLSRRRKSSLLLRKKKSSNKKSKALAFSNKRKNIQLYWYGHIHLHGNLKSNSYPSWILMHGILVSQKGHQFIFGRQLPPPPPWLFVCGLNPLHLYICMHILHTVLFTFPKVLIRRIC